MDQILTQFSRPPLWSEMPQADFAEQAANFCLKPLRLAFGQWMVTEARSYILDERPNLSNIPIIDYVGRFFIALFAFSLALPLTLAGVIFALSSSSQEDTLRGLTTPPRHDEPPSTHSDQSPKTPPRSHVRNPTLIPTTPSKHTMNRDLVSKFTPAAELPPLPDDFGTTLEQILAAASFEAPITNAAVLEKIQQQQVAAQILANAKTISNEDLPTWVTVFAFLSMGSMPLLLQALKDEQLSIIARGFSPKTRPVENPDEPEVYVPLRDLCRDALEFMTSHPGLEFQQARLLLSYCDPNWVAQELGHNSWVAACFAYSELQDEGAKWTAFCAALENKYYSLEVNHPERATIVTFFNSLDTDLIVRFLQLRDEGGLPLLAHPSKDGSAGVLLNEIIKSCQVNVIYASFNDMEVNQRNTLGISLTKAVRKKFSNAFKEPASSSGSRSHTDEPLPDSKRVRSDDYKGSSRTDDREALRNQALASVRGGRKRRRGAAGAAAGHEEDADS